MALFFATQAAFLTPALMQLLLTIVVVGVLLWLAQSFIPMEQTTKTILVGVVVIVLVLYILRWFGLI